jgi:multiple sugar transport system permease protein
MRIAWRRPSLKSEELRAAYLLILPATLGLLIFSIYPIVVTVRTSFYDVSTLAMQYNPVGFENYLRALQDPVFLISIRNTIFYTAGVVALQVTIALLLAILLNSVFPAVGLFRTAFFLPSVTSLVVVSTIWKIMLHSDVGIINNFLRLLNLPAQPWLTSPDLAMWSIIMIGVWKEVGFSMLVLLGGLNIIPSHFYEAAAIDGASPWVSFWKITLPLMRRSLLFVTVLATVNAIKVFIPVYMVTLGGPADSTKTLVYYIYLSVFNYFRLGYGAALSIILLLIATGIIITQFIVLRSDVEY